MAAYWGTVLNIAKSGGGNFNLNALDVESNGQAGSAVITGYSASGAVLQQQIVNFSFNAAGYSTVTASLGWVGVAKVSISWYQNANGTGGTRFGAFDNLNLSTGS
jgi:hypothetical protein